MNKFIHEVARYIVSELSNKLSNPGDERIGFSGPPDDVLSELFDSLVSEAGGTLVPAGSGSVVLPTYLLASNSEPITDISASCRCNQQHLTKIRTFGPPRYLFLLPCAEALLGTHAGTTETIGIPKPYEHLEDWLRSGLVTHLTDAVLAKYCSDEVPPQRLKPALEFALQIAWGCDDGHRDRRNTWSVLRRLLDSDVTAIPKFEAMCSILGLPRCAPDELGTSLHCKLLERLSDVFESMGLCPGLSWLHEQSDPDFVSYVDAFRSHLLCRCKTASDFSGAPTVAYSPINGNDHLALPDWWLKLTLQVWEQLLDGSEDKNSSGLEAVCKNTLAPLLKGFPSVVESTAKFEVSADNSAGLLIVSIERAVDGCRFQQYDSVQISSGKNVLWEDKAPEPHAKQLRYRFAATGYKPIIRKCIALDQYRPGVVVYSRNASKVMPFSLNKKARDAHGNKFERYECDISVKGIGTHQLDLYMRSGFSIGSEMVGHDVDSEQGEGLSRPINRATANHAVCVIETDEESFFEFRGSPIAGADEMAYRIWIEADGISPVGASSEFDRLVIEHIAAAKGERSSTRVETFSCRATDLQIWMIEDARSFYPLILGPDYLDAWIKPNYEANPAISGCALMSDPRPAPAEFNPSGDILEVRQTIQKYLRPNFDAPTNPIELSHLGELMCNEEFKATVVRYLDLYRQWLEAQPSVAVWMDVIAVHAREGRDSTLSPYPYAILLSPLHPIRFGWQCKAQHILKVGLDNHQRCPGASLLDPTSVPDSLILPCKSATGRIENKAFVSISSTSDYWGVLWNTDEIGRLSESSDTSIFGPDLGIRISGLATGFSVQQVVRSLNEVSRLSAGKITLSVALASDTTGASSCNDGVDLWSSLSLGPDGDEWHSAGGRSVRIYDERNESLQPEQAALASLTARTESAIRWFTGSPVTPTDTIDLGIVTHLGTSSPCFQIEGMRSAVDPSGLVRCRVRKQVGARRDFIAESRIGAVPPHDNSDAVSSYLLAAVDMVESACRETFDSYVFMPKLKTLEDLIRRARYCAVSSSSVDAACFFKATELSYLWDYELPPYGRRAGENSGYFLLARESPTMALAVRSALHVISPGSVLSETDMHSLLREISRRGMPTLRRLTTGGATSLGEVGMLVALRLLQSEFIEGEKRNSLIPVHSAGSDLNLIVPADPFKDQFDQLRTAHANATAERPDLLILSIKLINGTPSGIKITPVEVKARTNVMTVSDKQAALTQASHFAAFLRILAFEKPLQSELWAITWRNLLASLIDYGFRVYGQLPEFLNYLRWSELHSETLKCVMAGTLLTEIDNQGRLIVIETVPSSSPADIDQDGFRETIVLSHADAYKLVTGDAAAFIDSAVGILGSWKIPLELPKAPISTIVAPVIIPIATTTANITKAGIGSVAEPHDPGAPYAVPPLEPPPKPSSGTGLVIPVGVTIDLFQKETLNFKPGYTSLNQLNVGIVGDLGTGKTQLVKGLIHQLRSSPHNNRGTAPRFLIFDYKKDYTKDDFIKATGARVVKPHLIPLNFFDIRDCQSEQNAWLERCKFFSDALDKLYSSIGAPQRHRIKQAVRESYQDARNTGKVAPTIYDVFAKYAANAADKVDTPYSIMSDLVDGRYFAENENDIVPFSEFMSGVVVIDLASVGQDDHTKNMIVIFMLNLFYEHMLKIEKCEFIGTNPQLRYVDTFLLIDEADNIMQHEFDVLRKVLLQGREFGVGVILASQYLSHFHTQHENYCEPLLSWFVHKVPNVTVKELESIGLTRVDSAIVERIKTLDCHECLYKTFDVDGVIVRGTPFYELLGGITGQAAPTNK